MIVIVSVSAVLVSVGLDDQIKAGRGFVVEISRVSDRNHSGRRIICNGAVPSESASAPLVVTAPADAVVVARVADVDDGVCGCLRQGCGCICNGR